MTAAVGAVPGTVPEAAQRQSRVVHAGVGTAAPTTPATLLASAPAMSDADLDGLVAVLDALPDDIKSADPRTTPDYGHRLSQAIDRVTASSSVGTSTRSVTPDDALSLIGTGRAVHATDLRGSAPTARLAIDWIACGAAVAGVIAQYGLPVFKVVGWIREAREIYGSVRGIIEALSTGALAQEIPGEAAELITTLLGFDGVVAACFSPTSLEA
ncbi:hypothetical protein DZF92_05795 [Clavibacter michiganensis subsp. insidiosus]|uniref:Uncharacterized protein n=2 Tax=Clavibacter michiganensis TaxID=28447 RepID=A0A399N498_9MICO|nr:hypothetical protein [Clavibacter michiganensis]AWG00521.1 hypothetical protein BEH62_02785 [Clavibacter michiganensis subsp. insidiosus]OQJ60863.1 hypothetical protein B5P21_13755 [Clavibacter michiganensis subsp. insidiosus]RII87736.1 hypothetical protein DZF92_05795 [Clavibacter michiganensis subsp. insidiosus]RIJ44630.1 hypothetical protein DZF93_02085 [Clavibacter michiganensis subsp. insidiosus]RMC84157.1 hypothetical protein CmiCFBP2404_12710 [Clavibacter michiganensis subsp. insidio